MKCEITAKYQILLRVADCNFFTGEQLIQQYTKTAKLANMNIKLGEQSKPCQYLGYASPRNFWKSSINVLNFLL